MDTNQDPDTGVGEEEHHGKISVLKKVKLRAKKLKNTLTKHGHSPNQDQEHGQDREEDYEEDDDEEVEEDAKVHNAPMDLRVKSGEALLTPTPSAGSAKYQSNPSHPTGTGGQDAGIDPVLRSFGKMEISGESEEDKHDLKTRSHDKFSPELAATHNAKIHENPQLVPDSFQPSETKDRQCQNVSENVGVGGTQPTQPSSYTPHDSKIHGNSQFIPESFQPYETEDRCENANENVGVGETQLTQPSSYTPRDEKIHEFPQSVPESFQTSETEDCRRENASENVNVRETHQTQPSSYSEKKSLSTSANADKADLGTGMDTSTNTSMDNANTGAGGKPLTSTIADKAAFVKNVVAGKLGYGGSDTTNTRTSMDTVTGTDTNRGTDAGTRSMTSTIADKAASAKDVVAAKLGYGVSDATKGPGTQSTVDSDADMGKEAGERAKSAGVGEYGRQIASSVTGKLAPVYGAVAGAGSAVVSKIPGLGSTGSTDTTQTGTGESMIKTPQAGMARSKEYLSEKLKPGEEDKALSEIISEALHKRKDDSPDKMPAAIGKVTESPEVARRLGTESETLGKESKMDNGNPGKGMVEYVKGTVTSWFGIGGESNPNEAVDVPSHGEQHGFSSATGTENIGHENVSGERRLQESSN
ncbi:hypothetical protein GIB67_003775 [Kingdonia uniflora]|uniref:Low-temperature-induced 65 kDa protein n=1 Tax=Kingdonia uniflora TaxID=39325 RepID=A0A7J7M1L0_9MAGN|nr:hypothetical protein GIB67_003775 [Kingdonia uniflora]